MRGLLVVVLALQVGCSFICPDVIPYYGDAVEAGDIAEFVQRNLDGKGPVYCGAHRGWTSLTIYGILEENEQDRLIRLIDEERRNRNWNRVRVDFKDAEVLETTETENGTLTVRRNDKERVLRRCYSD